MGQNYLINHQAAHRLADATAQIAGDHPVVEIGAGLGSLTHLLLERGLKVMAIETEAGSVRFLQEQWQSQYPSRLTVLHQDFLRPFKFPPGFSREVVFLGNLPYHITSPILFKCFEECPSWAEGSPGAEGSSQATDLIFMMQREVADRILAPPGSKQYGRISTLARYHAEAMEKLLQMGPGSFYPPPKIASAVVHFKLRKAPLTRHYQVFKALVHGGFLYRRKRLKAALFLRQPLGLEPLDQAILKRLMEACEALFEKRAEELDVADYLYLANEYCRYREAKLPTSS